MPATVIVKRRKYEIKTEYYERSWGKGIRAELYEVDLVGAECSKIISFACQPEFNDFDHYQGMSPGQLRNEAIKRIMEQSGELGRLFDQEAVSLIRFNG